MPEDRPPRRALGALSLFALGINGIVGVGIFVAPPIVAASVPGSLGALVYPAIALACLPIALAYARLARAMPHDGGPCLYAERAFGAGTARAIGVVIWVSSLFSTAAVTRALGDLVASWMSAPRLAPAIACVLVAILTVVNLRGLRLSAYAWTTLTALKLAPLIVVGALGAVATRAIAGAHASTTTNAPIGPALLAVLFALQGFEIVALPAGQARDPARNVPRATIAALVAAGALYALVHLGCARAIYDLAASPEPIPIAARALGGAPLATAVRAGVAASIAGIVVGMHAMTPRYLSAVVRRASSEVDAQAIVVSAVVVAIFAAVGSLPKLVDLSSAAVLAQYGATASALLVLAARRQQGLRPRDAWPAPIGLAVVAVLLAQARWIELAIAAGVAIAGGVVASTMSKRA